MSIEAMKLALEALEVECRMYEATDPETGAPYNMIQAITALRQAIEQAQRQPLTDEEIQADFELWWYYEGSGPMLTPNDCEEHTKRMCEIAWKNGAYKSAHGIKGEA